MSKLDKLVIASNNSGKIKEIKELLSYLNIDIYKASEISDAPAPEETGSTFEENALIKARYYRDNTGMNAFSDDSGLVVPALGGAPGIYSARWAGEDGDFYVAMERIEGELKKKGIESSSGQEAYFICVLALALENGEEYCFEGWVDGHLSFPPKGEKGFGYDPIFKPEGYTISFAEMEPAKKHQISHRADAFSKFKAWLDNS